VALNKMIYGWQTREPETGKRTPVRKSMQHKKIGYKWVKV